MAKAWRVRGVTGRDSLASAGRAAVWTRVRETLSYESRARDPEDVTGLHDMRIAVKRLRYCAELLRPCFGPKLRAHVKQMRRLQELLGLIHDCDVMAEFLALKESEAAPGCVLGIRSLLERTHSRRATAHEQLCIELERLRDTRFWQRILESMGAG